MRWPATPALSSRATKRSPIRVRSDRHLARPCSKSQTRERRGPYSTSPRPKSPTQARRGPHSMLLHFQRRVRERRPPRRRVPVAPPAPGPRPPVHSVVPPGTPTKKTKTMSCFSKIVFQRSASHFQLQSPLRHAVDSGPWIQDLLQRPSRLAQRFATDSPTSLMATRAQDRPPPLPTLRYHCAVSAVAIRSSGCSTIRWAPIICFYDLTLEPRRQQRLCFPLMSSAVPGIRGLISCSIRV